MVTHGNVLSWERKGKSFFPLILLILLIAILLALSGTCFHLQICVSPFKLLAGLWLSFLGKEREEPSTLLCRDIEVIQRKVQHSTGEHTCKHAILSAFKVLSFCPVAPLSPFSDSSERPSSSSVSSLAASFLSSTKKKRKVTARNLWHSTDWLTKIHSPSLLLCNFPLILAERRKQLPYWRKGKESWQEEREALSFQSFDWSLWSKWQGMTTIRRSSLTHSTRKKGQRNKHAFYSEDLGVAEMKRRKQ